MERGDRQDDGDRGGNATNHTATAGGSVVIIGVAAMHTLVVAILGSFALAGLLRVDRRRLVRYLVVTAALTVGTLGGLRVFFATAFDQQYTKDEVLAMIIIGKRPEQVSEKELAELIN